MAAKKILFVTSEAHPLVKTGGLGDVAGSLPIALHQQDCDVRLVIPAYRQVLQQLTKAKTVSTLNLPGTTHPVQLMEGRLPGTRIPVYLVHNPALFDRDGGPYTNKQGEDWPDNALRFTTFAHAAVAIALNQAQLSWQVDIVHCNDWQSGLVPALLSYYPQRPATVFTIHNLAYQGNFSWLTFQQLNLPSNLWSADAMEFFGHFSFLKGGLVYADMLSTVSPTYAKEICTAEYGYGLEGLLKHRADRLTGILNGVDYSHWDPATDPLIAEHYHSNTLGDKAKNKMVLQEQMGLAVNENIPMLGSVGRLVEQKGGDLLLANLSKLSKRPLQIVVLGSGEKRFETALRRSAAKYPKHIAAHIGYDEALAHQIEAGADMFIMPSRYEPCGLNQIYSLKYGTIPIVRRTGGLADTVIDANKENLSMGTATGILFDEATSTALMSAINRGLDLYKKTKIWRAMMNTAMRQDFSWHHSAKAYLSLYQQATQLTKKKT